MPHGTLVLNTLIIRDIWDNILAPMQRTDVADNSHWALGKEVQVNPSQVGGDNRMRSVWHGKGTQRFVLTSPSTETSVLCIVLCQWSKQLSANICPLFSLIWIVPQPQLGFQSLPPFFSEPESRNKTHTDGVFISWVLCSWWEMLRVGRLCVAGGQDGNSLLFPQFCCEPAWTSSLFLKINS